MHNQAPMSCRNQIVRPKLDTRSWRRWVYLVTLVVAPMLAQGGPRATLKRTPTSRLGLATLYKVRLYRLRVTTKRSARSVSIGVLVSVSRRCC